jgi:integrase
MLCAKYRQIDDVHREIGTVHALQHRLGHSDVTVTLKVYGHLFAEMEADDVEEAADIIYKAADGGSS